VDKAIADGIGDGGLDEELVPALGRDLRRDDRRGLVVPVLEDLDQVTELAVLHGREQEVVEDEHVDTSEACECRGVCTIGESARWPWRHAAWASAAPR
jgi:hypothetical protein